MAPPIDEKGTPNWQAPIETWGQIAMWPFASYAECEAFRKLELSVGTAHADQWAAQYEVRKARHQKCRVISFRATSTSRRSFRRCSQKPRASLPPLWVAEGDSLAALFYRR
jgi:hypothetical protein